MYYNLTRADGYITIDAVMQCGWWTNKEMRGDGRRGVARGYYLRWSFDRPLLILIIRVSMLEQDGKILSARK